jgi:quinol monooxygenase YgiN
MILFIIRMKVSAQKRKELSQTISLLLGVIKTEKGCRRCDFCRSLENENQLFLLVEWETRADLDRYLNSERFKVLRGAMSLLQEPCETVFYRSYTTIGQI